MGPQKTNNFVPWVWSLQNRALEGFWAPKAWELLLTIPWKPSLGIQSPVWHFLGTDGQPLCDPAGPPLRYINNHGSWNSIFRPGFLLKTCFFDHFLVLGTSACKKSSLALNSNEISFNSIDIPWKIHGFALKITNFHYSGLKIIYFNWIKSQNH